MSNSYREILENRNSEERRERMRPILDRIPDHWGKTLPDPGWDDILLELDEKLAAIDPGYEIHQAKEKFGGLRFYTHFSEGFYNLAGNDARDTMYKLIGDAEARSDVTCEACGQRGRPREGGWIKTLCDEHATKEGK